MEKLSVEGDQSLSAGNTCVCVSFEGQTYVAMIFHDGRCLHTKKHSLNSRKAGGEVKAADLKRSDKKPGDKFNKHTLTGY